MSIDDAFGDRYPALEQRLETAVGEALGEIGFHLKIFSLREIDLGETGEIIQSTFAPTPNSSASRQWSRSARHGSRTTPPWGSWLPGSMATCCCVTASSSRGGRSWLRWDGDQAIPSALSAPLVGCGRLEVQLTHSDEQSTERGSVVDGRVGVSTSPWSGDSPDAKQSGGDETPPDRGRDGAPPRRRQYRVGMVGVPGVAVERQGDRRGPGRPPPSGSTRLASMRSPRRPSPYDASPVSQYAASDRCGERRAADRSSDETIVRPGFLPIIDQWKLQIEAGEVPTNLLENQDYLDGVVRGSAAADAKALAASARGEKAGDTADDYIRLTLFFATALFFAGHHRIVQVPLRPAAAAERRRRHTRLAAGSLLATYPIA